MTTKIINHESINKLFYLINNETEFVDYLLNKSSSVYNTNNNYLLTCDIYWDRIKHNFYRPIDKFTGIFDGNNHKIHNFKLISNPENKYVGLFGEINNATVKNLKLNTKLDIKVKSNAGCFAGISTNSIFYNCEIIGRININAKNGFNVGLFIGEMIDSYAGKISIYINNSVLRGTNNVGGFIGTIVNSQIKESFICGYLTIVGIKSNEICNNQSRYIGGFIGYSMRNSFIKCRVNFKGSLVGYEYVSGFVSIDSRSEFRDCCMEIIGGINSFKYTSLFCSETVDVEDKISIFCDCQINRKTQINNNLVIINNIKKYEKIANTKFKVTFKDDVYPKSYIKLLDLENKLLNENSIIYKILDYILTCRQLENIKVTNINVKTENEVLYKIKKMFEIKWSRLSDDNKKLFLNIGFNENSFNCIEFPEIKFNELNKNQKISALKLGFNQMIWDNKYVQRVSVFKSDYDFSRFYGLEMSARHILTFNIEIEEMLLTIPDYIRKIILTEIKEFIIEELEFDLIHNLPLNSNNVKVYCTDTKVLNIMVIINHIEDDCEYDDVYDNMNGENLDNNTNINSEIFEDYYETEDDEICEPCNNGPIRKDIYLCLVYDYNNELETNMYFSSNETQYKEFTRDIILKLTNSNTIVNMNDILCYDINNSIIGIKIKIDIELLEKINIFNEIDESEYIELLHKYLPNNLIYYPNKFRLESKIVDSLNDLNNIFCQKTKLIDYAVKVKNCFGNPVKTENIYGTILGIANINGIPANSNDIILFYVESELRGIDKIKVKDGKAWFNIKISTRCYNEAITFRIYQSSTELIYEVDKVSCNIIINVGCKYGNTDKPVIIDAVGKVPPIISRKVNVSNPKIYYTTPYKIVALIKVNFNFASKCDLLLAYVDNELRGKIEMKENCGIYLANGIIYSSGNKEIITFKVFSKVHNAIFDVPNSSIITSDNDILGTYECPLIINAIGKVYMDYHLYLKRKCFYNCDDEEIPVPEEEDCHTRKYLLSLYQGLRLNQKKKKIIKYNGCSTKYCSSNGCGCNNSSGF